ncbi:hypothetical protein [Nocardioides sp.]|uniref:hypothetical protein n=1 Tax=Nocardioides sp. TaxID=35761 RepID=UPI0039E4F649
MKRSARVRAGVVSAVALVAVGGTILAATARTSGAGDTGDAGRAVAIARQSLPASARDVHGDPGGELLSVDLRGDGSAEVLFYDYAADRAHQVTVSEGRVSADRSAAGLQPPASSEEARTAFGLASAAVPALRFTQAFAAQQGVPLVSPDQVQLEAQAWLAAGQAAASSPEASGCGAHRCVRLRIATAAGTFLDTSDFVVDLSAGRVLSLEGG